MGRPTFGDPSGIVISTMDTRPPSRRIRRTRSPTVTASSTIAVRMWGGETAASTPHCAVKSHSFLGWFTRASTLRHGELLLGDQRGDEVVLVVARGRHDDVGRCQLRVLEHPRLARVAVDDLHTVEFGAQRLGEGAFLLDQRDAVPAFGEVRREVPTDRASAADDDAHQWPPSGGASCSSSRSMPSFAMITAM